MRKQTMDIHLTILYFLMAFSSCSDRSIATDDIDKFISKYHNETFSDFMNVSISYRDSDFGDNIYMVAKQGGSYPPYIVRFNKRKEEVTGIDNKLLNQSNYTDYFTEKQIKNLMEKFIRVNVQSLSVDSIGNVFIKPFFGDDSPTLLRLKTTTGDSVVRKGHAYELYKDNWYLNNRTPN